MNPQRYFEFRLILILLLLKSFYVSAQPAVIDSLRKELRKHEIVDTSTLKIICDLAFKTIKNDSTIAFINRGLRHAEKINSQKTITTLTCIRGWWNYHHYNSELAMSDALFALSRYRETHPQAYKHGRANCLYLIGLIYLRTLETDRALDFFHQSLEQASEISHLGLMASSYEGFALVFEYRKQIDSALLYYQKSLAIREKRSNQYELTLCYNNIGGAYDMLGKHDIAKKYLDKALANAIALDSKLLIALVQQTLGQMHQRVGDFHQAKKRFLTSLQFGQELKDLRRQEEVLVLLSDLEKLRENYKEAYYYNQRLLGVKDSLYNIEKFKKAATLETQFATRTKEQVISHLQQEKEFESWIRWILVFMVLLALAFSVVVILLQRSRAAKTKQLLTVQQRLNEQLQEVDQVKSKFFAHISHEFRTPLTLVMAPLEQQLSKHTKPEDREQLNLIKRNATRLLELVNQLLDLAKLDAGKMDLQLQKASLSDLMKSISKSFESHAASRNLRFDQKIASAEENVWYDKDKAEKIVTNILSNAFKFTPDGGTIGFSFSFEGAVNRQIAKITIEDSGPGISKADQQYIFLPFYQGVSRNESSTSGTGLGLAMVKELIKLYMGDLQIDSVEGRGTIVTITLPCYRDAFSGMNVQILEEQTINSQENLIDQLNEIKTSHRPTVLVVEDNPDLKSFINSILSTKFNVLTAANGSDAIQQIRQHPPDIVVTDFMMPGINGIELTSVIKLDPLLKHIPVIVLTAKSDLLAKSETLKQGADDFITKPFSIDELIARISSQLNSEVPNTHS